MSKVIRVDVQITIDSGDMSQDTKQNIKATIGEYGNHGVDIWGAMVADKFACFMYSQRNEVHYGICDDIKTILENDKMVEHFIILTQEWWEGDSNYYYNSKEDNNES